MRAMILAVALFGAAATLLVGAAGAHNTGFKTKVVLTQGGAMGASGKVSCRGRCPATCLLKRRVTLFRTANGMDQSVGTARTNTRGRFRINAALIAGDYFAKVAIKQVGPTACAAAISVRYHF